MSLAEILREMEQSEKKTAIQDAEQLKKCLETLRTRHDLKVGDIVDWKANMKNKRSDGPFIVVEVLEEPVRNSESDECTLYFREPLDIVLGMQDSDGYFICFHYDSRRFQPVGQ